jgi:hypothetical protein
MEDTAKFFGKFSQATYQPLQNNQIIEDYTLDNELSTPEQRVYKNKDNNIVVASRGTHLKTKKDTLNDLRSDLLLSLGLQRFDSRFKREKDNLKKVEDKYCKDQSCNITTTGHSLGSQVANELGRSSNNVKQVISFNKGGTALTKGSSAKELAFYNRGDLLSNMTALTNRGKTIITNTKNKNKHSIANFI